MTMRMSFFKLAWIAIAALSSSLAVAQASELTVIELNTRTAEEVIPMLKPMLAPGGSISGLKDKLVIRTTPANLAELRRILAVVDAPPRRLQITVRQGATARAEELDVEISGSVGSDGGRVTLPDSSRGIRGRSGESQGDGVRVQGNATSSTAARSATQTVQVLEGNSAYIAVGESVPVQAGSVGTQEYVEYRDVVTGFYATPRVNGDRVTVALATSSDSVRDRDRGSIQVQRTDTVVSGRLGHWLEVGSISQATDGRDAGIVWYNSGAASDSRRIYIKVEELR
jgi:type II secretory pathway component HofQ